MGPATGEDRDFVSAPRKSSQLCSMPANCNMITTLHSHKLLSCNFVKYSQHQDMLDIKIHTFTVTSVCYVSIFHTSMHSGNSITLTVYLCKINLWVVEMKQNVIHLTTYIADPLISDLVETASCVSVVRRQNIHYLHSVYSM